VVETAEPCQRQPDFDVTSCLIGMSELGLLRSDRGMLAMWDSNTIVTLIVLVACTTDVVVYIVVYALLVGHVLGVRIVCVHGDQTVWLPGG
jgi:hypothetical protein